MDYRDDDVRDEGHCPTCDRRLSSLSIDGKGYCEEHGWVYAEWEGWTDPLMEAEEEED